MFSWQQFIESLESVRSNIGSQDVKLNSLLKPINLDNKFFIAFSDLKVYNIGDVFSIDFKVFQVVEKSQRSILFNLSCQKGMPEKEQFHDFDIVIVVKKGFFIDQEGKKMSNRIKIKRNQFYKIGCLKQTEAIVKIFK